MFAHLARRSGNSFDFNHITQTHISFDKRQIPNIISSIRKLIKFKWKMTHDVQNDCIFIFYSNIYCNFNEMLWRACALNSLYYYTLYSSMCTVVYCIPMAMACVLYFFCKSKRDRQNVIHANWIKKNKNNKNGNVQMHSTHILNANYVVFNGSFLGFYTVINKYVLVYVINSWLPNKLWILMIHYFIFPTNDLNYL